MGENVVAANLSATYSREVSHDAAVDMGLSPRPGNPQDILIFASFWSGTFGTYLALEAEMKLQKPFILHGSETWLSWGPRERRVNLANHAALVQQMVFCI